MKKANPVEDLKIVTWNIGGAKYLELPEGTSPRRLTRERFSNKLDTTLSQLCKDQKPHFIVLQEIVQYETPQSRKKEDLVGKASPPGYYYDASVAIDTIGQSHPRKWNRYFKGNNWPAGSYLAQGYGLLWRKEIAHASIWDFKESRDSKIEKEIVRLDTGLFTGDRSTEPRLAVVSHFIFIGSDGKPLDVFIVNLHLTTLKGEREGSPKIDRLASKIRARQIDVVLDGIISRYNEWVSEQLEKGQKKRQPAVWIIAGDFNSMPGSSEIKSIEGRNFIDLNPHKGGGTKGSAMPIEKATITLDYIFAGPVYYALDPYLVRREIDSNTTPQDQYQVSDHFPVVASVPIRKR